jgi:hypothetical protein
VIELIGRTWPTSMLLGGLAIMLAFSLGLSSGILSAVHQNSWIDYVVTFGSTLGLTVPNFVIALWMLLLFSVGLAWLPTGGWPAGPTDDWRTLIMPVITLSLAPMALVARYTRSSLVEVLHAEYVRTARAKGLRENTVVVRHALKNALIPLITILGPQIPNLITGIIFVEVIFRVPARSSSSRASACVITSMIMATMLPGRDAVSVTYLLSTSVHHRRPTGALDMSVVSAPALRRPEQARRSATVQPVRDARRRFSRNKLALGALAVMGVLLIMAVFADQLAPRRYDFSVLKTRIGFRAASIGWAPIPSGATFESHHLWHAHIAGRWHHRPGHRRS